MINWLGHEWTGTVVSIAPSGFDQVTVYTVDKDDEPGNRYPCRMESRFGRILMNKTAALNAGSYEKTTKTDIDYAMEDLQKTFDALKALHDDKFPKRRVKEAKDLIKTMKAQLGELQKLITEKK